MGGRGASSGISKKGKTYGTEYRNAFENGETFLGGRLKFVKQNAPGSVAAPMETMSKGRIYVTLSSDGQPNYITLYRKGKKIRQIDFNHSHEGMNPHTHRGYLHDEKGTRELYQREKKILDIVRKIWKNKNQD